MKKPLQHHVAVWWLTAWIASICWLTPSIADVSFTEDMTPDGRLVTIRMRVTPASEPVPKLKHRIESRETDLKSGNAAPFYYRAFMAMSPVVERLKQEYGEPFDEWYDCQRLSLKDLPRDKVRQALSPSRDFRSTTSAKQHSGECVIGAGNWRISAGRN